MKKTLTIFALILAISILVCGCGTQNTNVSTNGKDNLSIKDFSDNVVEIPNKITGATSNAASVTTHIVMIAGAEVVKIAPASFKTGHTEEFETFFSGTEDIKLSDGNKLSAETLIASGVNVFFTTKADEAIEYTKAGITSIVLNYDTIDNIARTFRIIGAVFGGNCQKKADKISQSIINSKSLVEKDGGNSSRSNSPTVYYISASTQTTPYVTQGKGTSTDTLLQLCGVTLLSPDKGLDVQVNPEYLLNANPDYILIDGYLAKDAYSELINDSNLKNLDAVKNKRIVIAPVGYFRPILRPGAESGIGLLWLANAFGNGIIDEASVKKEALDFYNNCLGFDLTQEDIHNMLNWTEVINE